MPKIQFTLNGSVTEASYEPGMHLLEVLRENAASSAPRTDAPGRGCGCCLVVIDGRPALSCLRKPEQMAGHDIVTLEGLPEETRRFIGAFVLEGGVQCGFCIPGIVVGRLAHRARQGGDRDARQGPDGHLAVAPAMDASSMPFRRLARRPAEGRLPDEPRRHHFFGEEFD
jgi:xanthine dehydrogenase molybdenum-binding subunit